MGCTSSAQNMAPSLANSEKELNMLEELDDNQIRVERLEPQTKGNESNGIKVLPLCDNLDEPTHIDSHKKIIGTTNQDFGFTQDSHANGYIMEREDENTDTNHLNTVRSESEERLSHLEEVVEKVVELRENGELQVTTTKSEHTSSEEPATKIKQEFREEKQDDTQDSQESEVEDIEEATSPSRSQSSRATRWEALADIAAELPPSLAVDPLTGQIYALSK